MTTDLSIAARRRVLAATSISYVVVVLDTSIGVLIHSYGWRSIFFVNAPICLAGWHGHGVAHHR